MKEGFFMGKDTQRQPALCWALGSSVLVLLALPAKLDAQSCTTSILEFKTLGASASKYGFFENDCEQSTPPKIYLRLAYTSVLSGSSTTPSGGGSASMSEAGFWQYARLTGERTFATTSGSATVDGETATLDLVDGWSDWGIWAGAQGFLAGCRSKVHACGAEAISGTCSSIETMTNVTGSCTVDNSTWSLTEDRITETLSLEYDDVMLREDILTLMPSSYPESWEGGEPAASSAIDSSHGSGELSKSLYRIKLPDTQKGVTYRVSWDEVTTDHAYGIKTVAPSQKDELDGER
jgi:hypothetical protein